jgi:hypothetical protein
MNVVEKWRRAKRKMEQEKKRYDSEKEIRQRE